MLEPTPSVLTYSTTTRPYGGFSDLSSTAKLVAWCLSLAAGSAILPGIGFFWGSGLVVLGTGLLQPIVLGIGFGVLFWRYAVRQTAIMVVFGLATAVVAIVCAHFMVYVHDVYLFALTISHDSTSGALRLIANGTVMNLRAIFGTHTFPGGDFVNSIAERFQQLPSYSRASFFHALLCLAGVFFAIKHTRDREWCEHCGGPMPEPRNLIVSPLADSDRLASAVVDGNVDLAGRLAISAHDAPLGTGCAIAQLHHCVTCGFRRADVVEKVSYGKGSAAIARTRRVEISDDMITALSSMPVSAVVMVGDNADNENAAAIS